MVCRFQRFLVLAVLGFGVTLKIYAENATPSLHDPTQPADYTQTGNKVTGTYEVRSIIITSKCRKALINNQYLSIGDHIGTGEIVAIEPNCVVILNEGKKSKLCIFSENIRK